MLAEYGAEYVEVSNVTGEGVNECFTKMVDIVMSSSAFETKMNKNGLEPVEIKLLEDDRRKKCQ